MSVNPKRDMPLHAAMDQFSVVGGQLQLGGMSLERLAARVGKTPFYVYDSAVVRSRVAELRAMLPSELALHYAMKANPMPELVCRMVQWVDGVDVASVGEMQTALNAGAKAENVSFAGPGKSASELFQSVAAGVLVNVESFRELGALGRASTLLGLPARVAVRVNPDFELRGSAMKMGGGARPFGVDVEQVPALLAEIESLRLSFEGFHIYAGSQNLNAQAICMAQSQTLDLACRLASFARSPVRHLNLGGGFGIPYFPGEKRLDLAPIADNLADLVERARKDLPEARLALELGRYLVGESGVYVARILDRKVSRGEVFLVSDGGLHHHLAASGNFGQVIRRNFPVAIGNRMNGSIEETASIVGPLCTPLDILADRITLPAAEVGDFVVVYQSGAYGLSASPSGFLGHPACPEILV